MQWSGSVDSIFYTPKPAPAPKAPRGRPRKLAPETRPVVRAPRVQNARSATRAPQFYDRCECGGHRAIAVKGTAIVRPVFAEACDRCLFLDGRSDGGRRDGEVIELFRHDNSYVLTRYEVLELLGDGIAATLARMVAEGRVKRWDADENATVSYRLNG